LTTGHAKILKGITDPERQLQLSKEIISRGLSVHATEAFVKQQAADKQAAESEANGATEEEAGGKTVVEKTNHVLGVEDELRKKLGVRLEIKVKAKDRGQIILTFESNDDFERVVEVLRR